MRDGDDRAVRCAAAMRTPLKYFLSETKANSIPYTEVTSREPVALLTPVISLHTELPHHCSHGQ